EVTLGGERLSESEIARLLAGSTGLHLFRGRWVEVDRDTLAKMLEQFRAIEQRAADVGLTFADATRMVAGVADTEGNEWTRISAGPWLAKTLNDLRQPEALDRIKPGDELKATLRPYQEAGLR